MSSTAPRRHDAAVTRRPELMILGAAVLFSTGGAAFKLCSFSAMHVAGLRALVAALLLFAVMPQSRRIGRPALLMLIPYVGATLPFVWANKLTTAANAIFLQSTSPLWVMLLAPWLLGEKARARDLAVLGAIAVGITMCALGAEKSLTAPDPDLGNVIALASGLAFGLLMLGFRWLGRRGRDEQASVVAWGNVAAALIACSLSGGLPQGDVADWLVILYLGLFQVGLAYLLLVRGTAQVPALQASLLLMAEPALNPVWAFLVLRENPGLWPICGGALIVGAVVLRNLRSS